MNALEDEAVVLMREVAAEFERPVLRCGGGEESIVLLRLAEIVTRDERVEISAARLVAAITYGLDVDTSGWTRSPVIGLLLRQRRARGGCAS